jgi:hypothetical protein
MRPRFEAVEVLDWYDGTVVGVVRIGGTDGLFLAALLCWAQESRLRVYALLEIERADVDRLKSRGEDWLRLVAEVEHWFAQANRDISIICVDERTETSSQRSACLRRTCWSTLSRTWSRRWALSELAGSTRSFRGTRARAL